MGRMVKFFLMSLIVLGLSAVSIGSHAIAQTADNERPSRVGTGPDRACLQCHKNENQMLGQHSKAISPNSGETVTCVNCHGNTSPSHRDGNARDVMDYSDKSPFPLDQRNGVCMSCHELKDMRKALWAHDVHVTRTFCTNCHQLHPEKDPTKGISTAGRIKLCVDCHGKLHEEKAAAKKAAASQGQGTP